MARRLAAAGAEAREACWRTWRNNGNQRLLCSSRCFFAIYTARWL